MTGPRDIINGAKAELGVNDPERFTDAGNARRLIASHGADLRYVPAWSTWLCWEGQRWRRDDSGEVLRRAKQVAADLWEEAHREADSDRRKQAVRWALQSENASRLRAMVDLAWSEHGIVVTPDELDARPWLFNAANGTLDLRRGVLRPGDPADLLTKASDVSFDASAEAPAWIEFLEQILPDEAVRSFVQESAGYTLTGLTAEQVLFFGWGGGANGKTTLLKVLLAVMGEYGMQAEPELLLARDAAHPTGEADLHGARLVVTSEIEEGRRLAEATVKRLTGGDRVRARFMRQDYFEYEPTHKLWVGANHKPIVRGTDHAIWRRLRLIPFNVTIPKERQDSGLLERLMAELPGVLAWAVAGCARWREHGLSVPDAVTIATEEYRLESDVLGAFIADECVVMEVAVAAGAELYGAYVRWCDSNGERAVNQRRFGQALTERGFDRQKYGEHRRWHWFGIGLATQNDLLTTQVSA